MIRSLGTYGRAADITPSDTVNIPSVSTADGSGNRGCNVYVGGAGNVKVLLSESNDIITFNNVPAGLILPVSVLRVYSTGTSATNLVALW